jgi:hypothetical protein
MNGHIREATFDDYEQVTALETRSGLLSKPREEWMHMWACNPTARRLPHWPIGWVYVNAHGRLAGYVGNIPLTYEFNGRALLTATARGWSADPEARSRALPLLHQYFRQPAVDLYLNTTVNGFSAGPFAVFESIPAPVGRWDRAAFWVADERGFAAGVVPRAASLLRRPVAVGMALWSRWRSLPRAAEVQTCGGFDARFDTFWERLRQARPHVLLGARNRETLSWHFRYALEQGAWIALLGGAAGMTGYAVFVRRDYQAMGIKRMRLADYQSLDCRASLDEVLAWALARCRAEGIHVLEVVGGRPRAPFHRKLPHWCFYYKTYDPALGRKLSAPGAWAPSSYDGDASL